jgi:pyruvate/2-oxoglutarate dehydrogenase complex dihydrolipoamide acyltransferase (E2) component
LRDRAASGSLTAGDFADGSFSVSSVGNLGGKYFVPTILRPQGVIVAIGKARKEAKWDEKTQSFKPADVLSFCYTVDHRVIDGASGAHFSESVKAYLEDPAKMILNMH